MNEIEKLEQAVWASAHEGRKAWFNSRACLRFAEELRKINVRMTDEQPICHVDIGREQTCEMSKIIRRISQELFGSDYGIDAEEMASRIYEAGARIKSIRGGNGEEKKSELP